MTVAVGGADLYYVTKGTGPVCLVLCNLGTAVMERQMLPPLENHLTLVYVDLRGSGQSTGDPASLTFDGLAEDLEAVRRHLGVDRVAVLGWSILGVLAIEYARRCPASVSHAIAVCTPPKGSIPWLVAESSAFFEAQASAERKEIYRANLAALPPGTPPAQAVFAQAPLRFFDPRTDMVPLLAGALFKPAFFEHLLGPLTQTWDAAVDPGSLGVPLLVALGRHDYVSPHVLWAPVLPALPTATAAVFERSGHQPFYEEPERFTEVVTDWMRASQT
jgi:proline iminopeptidase